MFDANLRRLTAVAFAAAVALASPAHAQLEAAITSGDASLTTTADIETALLTELGAGNNCRAVLGDIYPSGLQSFDTPRESYFATSVNDGNIALQATAGGRVYSWLGEDPGGSRYAYIGNPLFSHGSLQVPRFAETVATLRWLLGEDPSTDITQLPLTILFSANWVRDRFLQWITANGVTHTWTILVDNARRTAGTYDLWIQESTESDAGVVDSLGHGLPFLAWTNWYSASADVLGHMGLEPGGWGNATLNDYPSVDAFCSVNVASEARLRLAQNLTGAMPSFDTSPCTTSVGKTRCDTDLLLDADGDSLTFEYWSAVSALRSSLSTLELAGTDLFSLGPERRIEKLFVLLADKYRADVRYPMDKDSTPSLEFYRALFTDRITHYSRSHNDTQPDLGNFMADSSALNALAGVPRTVVETPTIHSEWTSTGLYLPPGRSITIRRTDTTTNEVRVKINFLRNTTRIWNRDGYKGPWLVTSPQVRLEEGRDYTLSSPFGGPLYVWWKGVASGAQPFEVEFDGVLEHPFLDGNSPADVAAFVAELDTTPFDWVDIRLSLAEIHMLTRHARNIINNTYGGDGELYAQELVDYLITNNYWYAGFNDPDIPPLPAEVQAFCTSQGLDCTDPVIHRKPKIQHANGENVAACGGLCSGNPFDSGGPIDATGWGGNHEMGHNLQRGRLNFYGGRSSETSNNIFPYFTISTAARDRGVDFLRSRGGEQQAYELIQDAILMGIPPGASHPLWVDPGIYSQAGERLSFYLQLAFSNGSMHVWTQVYLIERLFSDAIGDDTKWAANKDKLFFSTYSRTDARNISGNDFLYVVFSCMTDKDQLDYFHTWGVEVSAAAIAQVQACGPTESLPVQYYHTDGGVIYADFPGLPSNVIPLDGIAAYRDPDIDNDRARNEDDDLPFDPTEQVDSDADGIGNNADPDDDNDGMRDAFEATHGFDPLDPADGPQDADLDGYTNAEEDTGATDPRDATARPAVAIDRWVDAAALATARASHSATLLIAGDVLVAGGAGANGAPLSSAERYDPAANVWAPAAALPAARVGHRAVRLVGGDVLVVGGQGTSFARLAPAVRYSPAGDNWAPAGSLATPRDRHTATVLADGRVLVVGGDDPNGALASVELYDPGSNAWAAAAPLAGARAGHSATLLADGRVLVAGGRENNTLLASVEIYDPASNSWSAAASLAGAHQQHAAERLPDGRVMFSGGYGAGTAFGTVSLYSPGTNTWTQAGTLQMPRGDHSMVRLPDGSVLVAGGSNGQGELASPERAPMPSGAWAHTAGNLDPTRSEHTTTLLDDGRVLITGGLLGFEVLGDSKLYAY